MQTNRSTWLQRVLPGFLPADCWFAVREEHEAHRRCVTFQSSELGVLSFQLIVVAGVRARTRQYKQKREEASIDMCIVKRCQCNLHTTPVPADSTSNTPRPILRFVTQAAPPVNTAEVAWRKEMKPSHGLKYG